MTAAPAVSLPEMPLLAVLPGTGGLTRITDKRRVRRDSADVFCSAEEGVRGRRAVEWRLVDEVVPPSQWEEARARARAGVRWRERLGRPDARGRHAGAARPHGSSADAIKYPHLRVALDRGRRQGGAHGARPARRAAGGSRRHPRSRATASGRWRWRARSTTRSCILRTNEPELGLWCCAPRATRMRCWRMTRCSRRTHRIG